MEGEQQIQKKTSGLAIAAIIFAFLLWPVGLILAIIALVKISKDENLGGKTLAIIALVISSLGVVLVGLAMIGSLAYFGVLDTAQMLPEKCSFGNAIGCKSAYFGIFATNTGTVKATLVNNYGRDISISSFKVTSDIVGLCQGESEVCMDQNENGNCDTGDNILSAEETFQWSAGKPSSLVIDCNGGDSLEKGDMTRISISYDWYDTASGPDYKKTGQGIIQARVI